MPQSNGRMGGLLRDGERASVLSFQHRCKNSTASARVAGRDRPHGLSALQSNPCHISRERDRPVRERLGLVAGGILSDGPLSSRPLVGQG